MPRNCLCMISCVTGASYRTVNKCDALLFNGMISSLLIKYNLTRTVQQNIITDNTYNFTIDCYCLASSLQNTKMT